MGKVVGGMTISLDGFVNDANGKVGALYPDLGDLGQTDMLQESIRMTGAVVMGRHTNDMANGDFTGYEYQVPIFVVTHDAPLTVAKGENGTFKFNFVLDGIDSAVQQAKAAAGNKNVTLVGGANIMQYCLKAGLLDELEIGIMPIILGKGLRLFDDLSTQQIHLEKIDLIESAGGRTDIFFRVVK